MNEIEKKLIVCRCMDVTEDEIEEALKLLIDLNSESLIDQVKKLTSAGMGLCQSRTCQHLIERIINKETKKRQSDYPPIKSRPPSRPIKMEILEDMDI